MIKPLDFGTFKSLKKKPYNDMNRWIEKFYMAAYEQGREDEKAKLEKEYAEDLDQKVMEKMREGANTYTEDQLIRKLLTVPGIGAARAQQAADALLAIDEEEITS